MTQPPVAQKISLAVQDFIYKVADDLTTIVDEALEAFEDAAEGLQEKVKPVENISTANYSIYVDGHGLMTADEIRKTFEQAQPAPSKTGGSDVVPLSLRDTLGVVYDYMEENGLLDGSYKNMSKDEVLSSYKIVLAKQFLEHTHRETTGFPMKYNREA